MDLVIVVKVLGWISAINFSVLFLWFFILIFAKGWLYKLHSKWFSISEEKMDSIHYSLIGAFELITFAFFLAPYLALKIVL